MENIKSFKSLLYTLNDGNFESIALRLFSFQAFNNRVYGAWLRSLGIDPGKVNDLHDIPFLPVSLFKSQVIKTGDWRENAIFLSSGTAGSTERSRHFVEDTDYYTSHSIQCFKHFFGSPSEYHILALLPSYLERGDSSLVSMMKALMDESGSGDEGFYLDNMDKLESDIYELTRKGRRKVMLWGVTFALLDLAERGAVNLGECIVVETGGMKGRRKEITREAFHERLKNSLGAVEIHSEYGMTELYSQAYSGPGGRFVTPPTMKVIGREIGDPFNLGIVNRTCGLNIIDLANIHSIAFIETEDVGNVSEDGSFEVLGRLDNSDLRGCNLMVE